MVDLGDAFSLGFLESRNDLAGIEGLIFEVLSKGNADAEAQKWVAELFNPDGQKNICAKIGWRQGHSPSKIAKKEAGLNAFYKLLYSCGHDLKKTVALAQKPTWCGGLGLSRKTAYEYRKHVNASSVEE